MDGFIGRFVTKYTKGVHQRSTSPGCYKVVPEECFTCMFHVQVSQPEAKPLARAQVSCRRYILS